MLTVVMHHDRYISKMQIPICNISNFMAIALYGKSWSVTWKVSVKILHWWKHMAQTPIMFSAPFLIRLRQKRQQLTRVKPVKSSGWRTTQRICTTLFLERIRTSRDGLTISATGWLPADSDPRCCHRSLSLEPCICLRRLPTFQ